MTKQSLSVELDDETIQFLAMLGEPIDVLARLAHSAAEGAHHPDLRRRDQTDGSLRVERDKSDDRDLLTREAVEERADHVVRVARRRADAVVQTARDAAAREHNQPQAAGQASSAIARIVLENERFDADALLDHERTERRLRKAAALMVERNATDEDLTGERAQADTVLIDQREANAQMVQATIRAHELTEQAEAARELAEETTMQLRESEERYRTLFELCPAAVYSCDATGVVEKFNRHAVGLWGRQPVGGGDERFCGSFKLFAPGGDFMPHADCPMADVVSGKLAEVRDAEVIIERPDGSRITVVVNIRPLKNQLGEITGAINCFHDITERKQAENRNADLLKRERELSEFRDLFIGILGHDLRTPLGSISMSTGLLLQRGHLEDQDGLTVARIIRATQRMTRMIAQLLDLTRARLGGGLAIEAHLTDLRRVCLDVVEEFEAVIELEVAGDVTGTWDEDRLGEVISNLTGNAVEYAAPGTLVTVKAHAEADGIVVEVSNQGDPIPADVLPFIFEPFRRARQRAKSATGNLGLGLYIANQIVLAHGGTIDARCADGTTTFVMRLPFIPPADLRA